MFISGLRATIGERYGVEQHVPVAKIPIEMTMRRDLAQPLCFAISVIYLISALM